MTNSRAAAWIAAPLSIAIASAACGGGVQWTDPYASRPAAQERVLLANAMAEGDLPAGLALGRRIHPDGTLARLRYETFDADGNRLDRWEARALVPTLGESLENRGCPEECRAEIARGAAVIAGSGNPGISPEWILRMPTNRGFDLGAKPIETQDIRDAAPRRVPITFRRVDNRSLPEPANIRVTLVETCAARVRIGRASHLEFFPDAIVPIPRRFRATSWMQVDGCGTLPALPADGAPPPPPAPREQIDEPKPDFRAVTIRRTPGAGTSALVVDESWFASRPDPIEFAFVALCRYDPSVDGWKRLPPPISNHTIRISPRTIVEPRAVDRVVVRLPAETALFWVQWIERAEGERSTRRESLRDSLATSGPILCEDIHLGPIPSGRVAACVPFATRAEARAVPSPRQNCTR